MHHLGSVVRVGYVADVEDLVSVVVEVEEEAEGLVHPTIEQTVLVQLHEQMLMTLALNPLSRRILQNLPMRNGRLHQKAVTFWREIAVSQKTSCASPGIETERSRTREK